LLLDRSFCCCYVVFIEGGTELNNDQVIARLLLDKLVEVVDSGFAE